MNWIRLAAFILTASAEALASGASPHDGAVGSCSPSYHGKFEVTISKLGKRDIEKRSCGGSDALLLTLNGGILKDAKSRTGYIASNYQFQFDEPTQPDAIYTSGFSACSNGSLALRGSTVFYQCRSGTFYNLYDRNWAAQCEPIEILVMPCDGNTGNGGNGRGEVTVGTKIVQTTVVTIIADGQPQVRTTEVAIPICQISDGQIQGQLQGHDSPCSGRSPASPISQISDGQVVHHPSPTKPAAVIPTATGAPKPPGPPVTQLPGGQPQGSKPQAPPAGTGSVPKSPPSASPEAPVSGAERLLNNIRATIGILILYYMSIGI